MTIEAQAEDVAPTRGLDRTPALATLTWAALAVGALLQLAHFLGGRSFWLDEAMIVLNMRHLSFAELFGRLEYDQFAAIGWILLGKAATYLPLRDEFALRLPQLVAGLASLLLFRALAVRVLSPIGAFGAVALFALSPRVVRFAAEVKPYIFDIAFAAGLLLLGVLLMQRQGRSWGLVALLAVIGLIAVPISLPSAFVLAAVGGALILQRLLQGRAAEAAVLALASLAWAALFGVLMLKVYQPQIADTTLTTGLAAGVFERSGYLPFPPTSVDDLKWYAGFPRRLSEFMFGRDSRVAGGLMMAIGMVALALRARWTALMVGGTIVVVLLASATKAYPLFDRLTLFMLPPLMVATGAALDWLASITRPHRAPWMLMLTLLVAGDLMGTAKAFALRPPFAQSDVRPVLQVLNKERGPDDKLLIAALAVPSYLVYRKEMGLADMPWSRPESYNQDWSCMISNLPQVAPGGVVWVLFYPPHDELEASEGDTLLRHLGAGDEFKLRASAKDDGTMLYSVRPTPAAANITPEPACRDFPNMFFDASPRLAARLR